MPTRREALKTGLVAAGALTLSSLGTQLLDAATVAVPTPRERLSLDFAWRFHLGHASDRAQDFGHGTSSELAKSGDLFAPSDAKFDASAWRELDLPHDWAVELPFVEDTALVASGSKPLGRAYPATSIGWYRRTFELPASDRGRRLSLEFDGVFRDCTVAINGRWLGRNLSGYAPCRFDISDVANYGASNVLVVRVDASEKEGWFYEGAGIYRHVWLVKTNPVRVPQWGTYVTTSTLSPRAAMLTIVTQIENTTDVERGCYVTMAIRPPGGGATVQAYRSPIMRIPPRSVREVSRPALVENPRCWSPAAPTLYTMESRVMMDGAEVDRVDTSFGIRTIQFDADRGFLLNGERVELRGTCNHQDHAGIGVALPDRLQEWRIARLKSMGANAYRTSHNPPTPELLDVCDRLGMLVLDETRMFSSSEEGMSQLERMVRRDRGHPCVFAWAIANEEWAEQGDERGARIANTMKRLVKRLDHSRPVTAAMDGGWGRGISTVVDVQGCNYERPQNPDTNLEAYHRAFPHQPAMGTEVASTYCTRGVYVTDAARGYINAYDVNKPSYGATAEQWWTQFAARPWLAGGFVWTGFDYRGEPSPYAWPCISSHFGIMDTCGFPKDNFYYYQAWWGTEPVLHLFPHWNWAGREGEEIEVWCHTNLERVELRLNGSSLGTRAVPRQSHAMWRVPFEPGTLEAHGVTSRGEPLVAIRETTGPAAKLVMTPDRLRVTADGRDAIVIATHSTDATGRIVPIADHAITFRVEGNGRLLGVGNGDPSSHEADKGSTRRLFNGLCQTILATTREAGLIRVTATADGLVSATLELVAEGR